MILRRTVAAVLSVTCLGLAACSSSDDAAKSPAPTESASKPAGSSSSTTPSSSVPSSSASSGGADLAAIVVQQSEVPSTFTPTAPDEDDSGDADLLACIGAKSTKADEQATVHSKDFSTETASISSQVTRFGSQASVDADAKIFSSPKTKSCFSTLLKKQVSGEQGGATVVSTDVDVTPGTNGGPSNVVATTTATVVLEKDGKQAPVYIDAVYITGPKLEAEIDFTSFGTQFDSKLATTVASAVAKRAAAA